MEWKDLEINPDYEKILPKLSKEEYEALKASIKINDIMMSLIVNSNGIILDGHNRYRIAEELKFSPTLKFTTIDFKDPLEERAFVITINLQRRNLNDFQKAEMGMALLDVEKKLAKQRKLAGKTIPSQDGKGEAVEIIGKKIGLGARTFERAKKVIEKAPEEVKKLCRDEALGIRPAYGLTKAFETVPKAPKKALTEKLVNGKLGVKEIVKSIASTNAVKAQLEGEEEAVKTKAEALFKDQYYTEKLNSKDAIWEIEEIAGDPHNQVKREFPLTEFVSFEEAQEWAKERGGVCLGTVEKWLIKFDPLKDKKIKEAKKDESES